MKRLIWAIKWNWFHVAILRLTGKVLVARKSMITGRVVGLYWDHGRNHVHNFKVRD